jgi:ribosome recycling factor
MPVKDLIADAKQRMHTSVETVRKELAAMRTGRASLTMLDGIRVDYYGTPTPLNQVGNLSTPDPTLIQVQPWDQKLLGAIEKAIRTSDLDLNPQNDGKVIRIPIPPLTEDRRKQLAKKVHETAEHHRTAIRLERREANEALKKMLKDKTISEDDEKRAMEQIQKLTDLHIKQIDDMAKHKEEEILKI